jgi:hypothetical protein
MVRELGLPAVLAMTGRISIATAQALASAFYARLREHGEVDRALSEALTGLQGRHDVTIPALFSRLGGRPLWGGTPDQPPATEQRVYQATVSGSGAIAQDGSVAAGAGGIAIGGDVQGGVRISRQEGEGT